MEIQPIAYIHNDFKNKFGIPRQSGLADTHAEIIFEPAYGSRESVRGLEAFSYIWLIWGFSENAGQGWHPTVRPPRLGGNKRVGVYASRSPFRPNPLGLSSVRLEQIEFRTVPVLHVAGADLMDGTPIYDIKPYHPDADSHPDAAGGFISDVPWHPLHVHYEKTADTTLLSPEKQKELAEVLREDPRPPYQHDPERIYGMTFGDCEIKFRVENQELFVQEIFYHKKNNPR